MKVATSHRSMSDIVNDALRASLQEDEADLSAFAERNAGQSITYEQLVAQLKADGTQ